MSKEREARLILSKAETTNFLVPAPQGLDYFPYQRAGVEFATLTTNTLFADPPGVGKTIQAIGFMNVKKIETALILCPASVVGSWKREIEKWHLGKPRVEIFHPKSFDARRPPDILIFSYAFASMLGAVKQVLGLRYQYLVLDECHFLKEPKAKRTKHVLAKNGLVGNAEFVHALSGTPIVNRPIEIYPVIKSLCPQAIDNMNYFEYGLNFCKGFKSQWGWDFSGASNLKVLGLRLRSHFMIRRPKESILSQLPQKFEPNVIYLAPDDKETKELVMRMASWDEASAIRKTVSPEFTELSEMRRELGERKVSRAVAYIATQLDSGHEKIVVFAHHKKVIQGLADGLERFGVVSLTGDTPGTERESLIHKFQNNKGIRVFIGSVTAAGVGITLTAASYGIFVEFSWVPGENEQAEDRMHRIGQKECVMIDYLVHEKSLDERILKVLRKKSDALSEVFSA